jgi:tetratricopeptide (TPR) repeat protein
MTYKSAALLIVILVMGIVWSPALAQDTPTPSPLENEQSAMRPPDILATAQAMVEYAERVQQSTLDRIGSFMTFLEAAGVIVTILGVLIGGLAAYRSINISSRLSEIEEAKTDIFETRGEYNSVLAELRTTISQAEITQTQANIRQQTLENLLSEALELQTNLENKLRDQNNQLGRALSLAQLGARQTQLGNKTGALNIFREAAEIVKNNPMIHYFMGDLYLRLGDYHEGSKNLKITIEQEPNFLPAKLALAYALRLEGDRDKHLRAERYKQAEELFMEVYASDKDRDLLDVTGESAYGALAGLYKRMGQYDKAREFYEHCETITPYSSYPIVNLGLLYYSHGEHLTIPEKFAGQDTRSIALHYFETTRKRAIYAITISSADHWRFFDLIVSETVLMDTDDKITLEHVQDHIDQAFARTPIQEDRDKILDSLDAIRQAPNPPKHIDDVIQAIKSRLGKAR